MLSIISCGEEDYYLPKPQSYFRIDFPEKEYVQDTLSIPVVIERAKFSIIEQRKDQHQFNLVYPQYKAKVHFTYFSLEDKYIQPFLEDAYNYAYQHNVKAAGIKAEPIRVDENKVYGLTYDLKGNVASPIQFFLTDSTSHFLRGALYFELRPNADSLAPVKSYLSEDLAHMYKTLQWKK